MVTLLLLLLLLSDKAFLKIVTKAASSSQTQSTICRYSCQVSIDVPSHHTNWGL